MFTALIIYFIIAVLEHIASIFLLIVNNHRYSDGEKLFGIFWDIINIIFDVVLIVCLIGAK